MHKLYQYNEYRKTRVPEVTSVTHIKELCFWKTVKCKYYTPLLIQYAAQNQDVRYVSQILLRIFLRSEWQLFLKVDFLFGENSHTSFTLQRARFYYQSTVIRFNTKIS
jgi:hypothetical protein